MKQFFVLTTLVVAMASSAIASAETKSLTLSGTITPASCTLAQANDSLTLKIPAVGSLSPSDVTEAPPVTSSFTIKCQSAATVRMKVEDAHKATLDNSPHKDLLFKNNYGHRKYGLVTANSDQLIGAYKIGIEKVSEANNEIHIYATNSDVIETSLFPTLSDGATPATFVFGKSGGTPTTDLAVDFKIYSQILPTGTWTPDSSGDTQVVGEAVFTMAYL